MEKLNIIVQGSLEIAQSETSKRKNPQLTTHHFLYGLIKNPKTSASKNLADELPNIIQLINSLPVIDQFDFNKINLDSKMQEWLTMASSNALEAGRDQIYEVDFLKYLKRFYPYIKIAEDLADNDNKDEKPDFLDDLNEIASRGKLDPVIGRSKEIRKVMEILCRRTKNNPVLVGQAGVGKTAIVEGLTDLIVKNKVPDIIQGRRIYSLQMGNLIAGTKFRGEFEEKIQTLLKFLKNKGREVVLFIDEVHLLIGAGRTDGSIDAANLLKPALARGELNCIGATTLAEYKKYIESDSALERRFHKVEVAPASVEDTIQILIGLREKLEIHHGIEITNEAIIAASKLSDQYIQQRNLPDKAIDVLDEAAAGLKLSADSPPPRVQELESLILSKKILLSSQDGNQTLKKEIEILENELNEKKETWEKNVLELKQAAQLKKELDKAQFEFEKQSNLGNYEEASKLKYTTINELSKQLKNIKVSWKLTKNEVAAVISRSTGIPIDRILSDRQVHILNLANFLNQHILGQSHALNEIANHLIAAHAGLTDQTRPLGSFLLLGPSGVGKTETAKKLSLFLFHDEKSILRFDLSEFRESHSVAKIIGAPPGYIGYDKGGTLTEAVKQKPYRVILFDEIEKAHADFGDILLQILDDGTLTDSSSQTIDFKNTVIIVTSNLVEYEKFLKPELIGRFDAIITYNKLDKNIIQLLVDKKLLELNKKLANKKTSLKIGDNMMEKLIEMGFDERYGARPLNNYFNKLVVNSVARFIMEKNFTPATYVIDIKDSDIVFNKQ